MESIRELIASYGGIENLPELSPLRIEIDPDRYLIIEDCGTSPNRFPAVGVSFFLREEGHNWHSRIIMEMTGLGLLPFYLRTRHGDVFQVYRLSHRGRIRKVRRDVRATLVWIAQDWDARLDLLLGREVVLT